MLGLAVLFAVAIAIVVAIYVGGIAYEALHPPRATMGWAIGRGRPSCPADLGLAAKEWTLERPGARLPVWEIELSDAPHGLTVIVVHGWGRSRIDSLGRIAPYLDHADRVMLVDLRGHGDATGRTKLGDGEEDDIAALIERCPEGPVVLVGHSMGATIAIRCAAQTPAALRIAGVVAIAPYDTLRTPMRLRLWTRELPAGAFVALALLTLRAFGIRTPSTVESAARLRAPLLVIHGEDDRIAPLDEGRAIAKAGRGSLLSLEDVEHADHEVGDPARIAEACGAFLEAAVQRENGTGAVDIAPPPSSLRDATSPGLTPGGGHSC